MKSIVLCEPNYGGQSKRDRTSDKSKKNGSKSEETKESSVKEDDSLSDIEICQIIGNAINGEEKTDMRKDESNNGEAEEREKCSADGNCAVGESVEAGGGASETSKDEEEIEILSCSVKINKGVSENSKSFRDDILGKSNECSMEDSNSLSNCKGNSGEQDSHENGLSDSETAKCNGPCITESEPVEEVCKENERSPVGGEESNSDRVMPEVNPGEGGISSDSDVREKEVDDEKIENECDTEETGRGKQSSDDGFIEEEENKENRSNEGCPATEGDAKTRRKENSGTPVVESVESAWETDKDFKSSWNEGKSAFHGSLESNGVEQCLADNDINMDEIETWDYEKNADDEGKNVEYEVSEEGNVAVGSSEKSICLDACETAEEVECCPDLNQAEPEGLCKFEEEIVQKRKRLSIDCGELVETSVKKRKTENCATSVGEVRRRHSHDAAFVEDITSESCHNSEDNEKEAEKPESENGTYKKNTLEESIDRVASAQITLPFLESLRGTIKTLSRSDLEELIVQKLCEVITERSTVGDLRKKAQALEQDQERWKEKVQSLTKQLREMDMVMKKYMSEVQKQNKERNFQMVTPLRVTRSVGLQVSFGSPSSKLSKVIPNSSQPKQSVLQAPEKLVKPPSQLTVSVSQNAKKNVPILPSTQSKKPPKEPKKPFAPRLGVNVTFQARLISPQAMVTSNRTLQTQQMNTLNRPRMPVSEQSNSKIIDLTDDDDRQNSQTTPKTVLQPSVTVRPPGQIRVVNHIQPAQVNSGGRIAYLVPATTAAASGSTVPPQSRHLLIATPTVPPPPRQLLPSVPPLLYKGSTILQPGAQQPTLINQQNRTLMPKKLKHPAPLPQPPANQIQKPNLKLLPPRPALKISKVQTGIVLSWNMTLGPEYEPIASYQLYAYQENNSPPATSLWKKVGDVKALPLPMACTLTQFMSGHKYYFAVRAVDLHSRIGPFSFPGSIVLIK